MKLSNKKLDRFLRNVPSAANEQLVDKPNDKTGADTGVGNVTAEHHHVKGRIEDNVTLHSDATEGTEMVDTVV
jgi:hypothetical protein